MTECHPSDSYSAPHIDIRTPKKLCRDATARLSPSLQDYSHGSLDKWEMNDCVANCCKQTILQVIVKEEALCFLCHPSIRLSIHDVVSVISMVCIDRDFHQTFVSNASYDKDEQFSFGDQKGKGQGHSMTKCAKNTFLGG